MKLFFLKLKDKFWFNFIFLFVVLTIYFITALFNFEYFFSVWKEVVDIFLKQIFLVLIIVFIFMFVLNLLLKKDLIKNKIENSKNSTKYIFSIIGWIFSTWPVYMWYPFLKTVKNHGFSYGHIATFIYARAIKIPFLAAMIMYFGLKYTIIFNIILLFFAFIIGVLINLIFNFLEYEKNNS